jgi:hypothetical protein
MARLEPQQPLDHKQARGNLSDGRAIYPIGLRVRGKSVSSCVKSLGGAE